MREPGRTDPGPRWWAARLSLGGEVLLFLVLTFVYEWLRDLVAPASAAVAVRHAADIVQLERGLGLFIEPSVQRAIEQVPGGQFTVSWLYTLGHTPGFICFFLWLWWRHRDRYAFVRTWFWVSHAVAVTVFWLFPLAPPRLAGLGLADPTRRTLELGGAASWFEPFRNQFAAMPSLHVGYTLFFAVVIAMVGRTRLRWLAFVWPAAMLVVVMATANHYWLDGVGGALTMAAGLGLTLVADQAVRLRMRRPWEARPA